jgi:hypothetical protein
LKVAANRLPFFCRHETPNNTSVSYFEEIANSVSRLRGGFFSTEHKNTPKLSNTIFSIKSILCSVITTILIENQTDSYKTPHILTKVSMVNIINTCLVTPYSLSHHTSEKTGEHISGSLQREAARSPETSVYTTS